MSFVIDNSKVEELLKSSSPPYALTYSPMVSENYNAEPVYADLPTCETCADDPLTVE
jgi:hypothetical protein